MRRGCMPRDGTLWLSIFYFVAIIVLCFVVAIWVKVSRAKLHVWMPPARLLSAAHKTVSGHIDSCGGIVKAVWDPACNVAIAGDEVNELDDEVRDYVFVVAFRGHVTM